MWSDDRHTYKQGKKDAMAVKFHVSKSQAMWIKNCLRRDTDFLIQHGLMDYSLIVGRDTVQ
jgi:hypothetical protein